MSGERLFKAGTHAVLVYPTTFPIHTARGDAGYLKCCEQITNRVGVQERECHCVALYGLARAFYAVCQQKCDYSP